MESTAQGFIGRANKALVKGQPNMARLYMTRAFDLIGKYRDDIAADYAHLDFASTGTAPRPHGAEINTGPGLARHLVALVNHYGAEPIMHDPAAFAPFLTTRTVDRIGSIEWFFLVKAAEVYIMVKNGDPRWVTKSKDGTINTQPEALDRALDALHKEAADTVAEWCQPCDTRRDPACKHHPEHDPSEYAPHH